MTETNFSRKLDNTGRIMIPSKLRDQLNLEPGQEYKFYIHSEQGKRFIAIECGEIPVMKVEELKKIAQQHGLKLVKDN